MIKMSRLAVAFLGTAVLVLPMAAAAEPVSESPAIAVSIGATFAGNGETYYNNDATPSSSTGLESLAVSVASGQHAAVANAAALVNGGSAANAGAANASNTDLDSTVSLHGGSLFGAGNFESDVNISDSDPEQINYNPCYISPMYCFPY